MWASALQVKSSNRNIHNVASSQKYMITCKDRITPSTPTTNEWLTVTGTLKATNQRDLNRVLKGILEHKKAVAIKISDSATLQKEYTIASILSSVPGFMKPYCFFQCNDNYKEHPSSTRKSLCKGPGTSMSVLVMPYLDIGSMRSFAWDPKKPAILHSCLFQLFCSLMQAYEMKGIIHSDTHMDNVLLEETTESNVEYTLGGKSLRVPTNGYKTVIMDFELSFNEDSKNRGRSFGAMYDDLLHAITDLQYASQISLSNERELINALMDLKTHPLPTVSAIALLVPLIKKLRFTSKVARTFVYDPSVFG